MRNVQLRQGDLYALPVERDAYDLVVLHQVLHYLDDPSRAIREAARALRPAGRLLIYLFQHDIAREPSRTQGHQKFLLSTDELLDMLDPDDRVAVFSFDSHLKFRLDFTNLVVPTDSGFMTNASGERLQGAEIEARYALTYVRVPYDVETAARKIIDAGLPSVLGTRLFDGF